MLLCYKRFPFQARVGVRDHNTKYSLFSASAAAGVCGKFLSMESDSANLTQNLELILQIRDSISANLNQNGNSNNLSLELDCGCDQRETEKRVLAFWYLLQREALTLVQQLVLILLPIGLLTFCTQML